MHDASRPDRQALYRLARCVLRRRVAPRPAPGAVERLLLVRVDERVGNLIMLQSLIDALRAALPRSQLGLLSSIRMQAVTEGLTGVDQRFAIDKRWFFRHPLRWRKVIAQVRRARFEIAIDASAWHEFSFTHAALTFYSGAPIRIGYARGVGEGFYSDAVRPGPAEEYELKQRVRLLLPLGIAAEPPPLRSELGAPLLERWTAWLRGRVAGHRRVGLWPGSRKLERRWPLELYARLGRELAAHHSCELVVLWGPGEEGLRDALVEGLSGAARAAPATDVVELAGLLRALDLVVTNDTGPMHLAAAVGTPTVCLFASGEARRWGHPLAGVRNLQAPGTDVREVERALAACEGLIDSGRQPR